MNTTGRIFSRFIASCLALVPLLGLFLVVSPAPAQEQETSSSLPIEQRLDLSRGVQVEVQVPAGLSKQKLADALEGYVTSLRESSPESSTPVSSEVLPLSVSSVSLVTEDDVAAPLVVGADGFACWDVADDTVATGRVSTCLPATLLWQPPLANPYEPRFFIKLISVDTPEFHDVADFNIGGTLAVVRSSPVDRPDEGIQLDLFAMVFSRFTSTSNATAVDYRFGIPLTFAWGRWSAKLAYEHTSTHLGDEYMLERHTPFRYALREEATLGLAYRPLDDVRLYGIYGYAFHLSSFNREAKHSRFGVGAEWSRPAPTGGRGQPFAAIDLELRGVEDYTPNLTAQVGWQWIADASRPGLRFALEYYDGRTPFGQFSDRHENWFGVGLFFDY